MIQNFKESQQARNCSRDSKLVLISRELSLNCLKMPGRAGNKASSSSTPSRATDTSVHEKLDLILKRLDSFDSRLTKLELEQTEMAKGLNFMGSGGCFN